MANPFKELKEEKQRQTLLDAGFEEVEGRMACQKSGCKSQAFSGMYSEKARVLIYKCAEGHTTKIENFVA